MASPLGDCGGWYCINLARLYRLSGWLSGTESTCQCRRCRFDPWVGKNPWSKKW